MTAAVGFPTLRLVRVRVGAVLLNDLKSGQVIEIDDFKNIFC
jgi:23S rRNA pseudouridine2457 synthase